MSDDWKVGDLALCVDTSRIRCGPRDVHLGSNSPPLGSVKVVTAVLGSEWRGTDGCGCAAIMIEGGRVCHVARFIKVTPPAADEFDREVINLMQKQGADA